MSAVLPPFVDLTGLVEEGETVAVTDRAAAALWDLGYRKVAPAQIPGVSTRDDLTGWMEAEGWEKVSTGSAGEMWEKEHRVAVPHSMERGSHEWMAVLERIAA